MRMCMAVLGILLGASPLLAQESAEFRAGEAR